MRALLIFVVALDFVAASTGYTLPGADERAVRSDISYIRCAGASLQCGMARCASADLEAAELSCWKCLGR